MNKEVDCLIVLNKFGEVMAAYGSNEERDVGLHNMGIDPELYEKLGWKAVVGKVVFDPDKAE